MAAARLPGLLLLVNRNICKRQFFHGCRLSLSKKTYQQISPQISYSLPLIHRHLELSQWTPTAYLCTAPDLDPEIQERVFAAIRSYDKLGPNVSELTLSTRFKEDLSMDSLDHVEMITLVEDEFGIEIPDTQMEKMDTPAKIVHYLCTIKLPEPEE